MTAMRDALQRANLPLTPVRLSDVFPARWPQRITDDYLTRETVEAIRADHADGLTIIEIAHNRKMAYRQVYGIVRRQTYRRVA